MALFANGPPAEGRSACRWSPTPNHKYVHSQELNDGPGRVQIARILNDLPKLKRKDTNTLTEKHCNSAPRVSTFALICLNAGAAEASEIISRGHFKYVHSPELKDGLGRVQIAHGRD